MPSQTVRGQGSGTTRTPGLAGVTEQTACPTIAKETLLTGDEEAPHVAGTQAEASAIGDLPNALSTQGTCGPWDIDRAVGNRA